MTERKLSTLGYLMDRLGLSTAALARRLHVDASLVSKWRSGSRRLSAKSVYFDEVCRMLLEQNPMALTDALRSLVPLEEPKREEGESGKRGDGSLSEVEGIWGTEGISGTGGSSGTEELLYRVLNDRHFTVPKAFTIRAEALCTAEIAIYTSGEGRRQAISDLLEIAEAMETPGELFYVDSEQTGWLLEDTAYARNGWYGWSVCWTGDLFLRRPCIFCFGRQVCGILSAVQSPYIPPQCPVVLSPVL